MGSDLKLKRSPSMCALKSCSERQVRIDPLFLFVSCTILEARFKAFETKAISRETGLDERTRGAFGRAWSLLLRTGTQEAGGRKERGGSRTSGEYAQVRYGVRVVVYGG